MYFHQVRKLENPHPTVKHFIRVVQHEILRPTKQAIPRSAHATIQWRKLQVKIDNANGRERKASMKPHFCRFCGYVGSSSCNVTVHGKKYHSKNYPNFKPADSFRLDDIERYYDHIKNLKNPHESVKDFVTTIRREIRKADVTSKASSNTSAASVAQPERKRKVSDRNSLIKLVAENKRKKKRKTSKQTVLKPRKRQRKQKRPRPVPENVFCFSRFSGPPLKKQKIPLGCENEVDVKIKVEPTDDVYIKTEPN